MQSLEVSYHLMMVVQLAAVVWQAEVCQHVVTQRPKHSCNLCDTTFLGVKLMADWCNMQAMGLAMNLLNLADTIDLFCIQQD